VRNIKITANNDVFVFFHVLLTEFKQDIAKLQLVTESRMISPAIGKITVKQDKIFVLQNLRSAFFIKNFASGPVNNF